MTAAVAARRQAGERPGVVGGELMRPRVAGPLDWLPVEEVLELLAASPARPAGDRLGEQRRGARRILHWLQGFAGQGWRERWLAAQPDDLAWVNGLAAEMVSAGRSPGRARVEVIAGLAGLLVVRLVAPSYDLLANYHAVRLFDRVRVAFTPQLFARLEQAAAARGLSGRQANEPLVVLAKMLLHTGKSLDQLTGEDFLQARAWSMRTAGRGLYGLHTAWDLCQAVKILPGDRPLRAAVRDGQRPTAELVDRHNLRCAGVRDLIVRYCEERRPALDYTSLTGLVSILAGVFWADLEEHHPGIDSLHLAPEVARAWKERAQYTKDRRCGGRERRHRIGVFMQVRAFYLDIQQWALEDPSWAPWAVPCPIRKTDTEGMSKVRQRRTATMHQRVRERLPQLPLLVATAERDRHHQASLLAKASMTTAGDTFDHDGRTWRRVLAKNSHHPSVRQHGPGRVYATTAPGGAGAGDLVDLTRAEDDAFWAWAVIETLRHTGVRVEELLEITHLALISYQLPDTGEIVPMLQIVPSKTDTERLLLVSPELASVLAAILTRIRGENGKVPLVARYDVYERTTGTALPHLFQRGVGARREVISPRTVRDLLGRVLTRAGLTDATGQSLRYTPHDFRRIFATDAVTGGLPVHIAAKILGHANLNTTQAYLAVFADELIRSYRAFLAQRRRLRPEAEYRQPTDAEWQQFHDHFQLRKVSLGTCGRPYGTPCTHEHACVRCPMLRPDPAQRARLAEIIDNLHARINEAHHHGWLGEAQGLQVSLDAARDKLTNLDRLTNRGPTATDLGLPVILGVGGHPQPGAPEPAVQADTTSARATQPVSPSEPFGH